MNFFLIKNKHNVFFTYVNIYKILIEFELSFHTCTIETCVNINNTLTNTLDIYTISNFPPNKLHKNKLTYSYNNKTEHSYKIWIHTWDKIKIRSHRHANVFTYFVHFVYTAWPQVMSSIYNRNRMRRDKCLNYAQITFRSCTQNADECIKLHHGTLYVNRGLKSTINRITRTRMDHSDLLRWMCQIVVVNVIVLDCMSRVPLTHMWSYDWCLQLIFQLLVYMNLAPYAIYTNVHMTRHFYWNNNRNSFIFWIYEKFDYCRMGIERLKGFEKSYLFHFQCFLFYFFIHYRYRETIGD